MRILSILPLLFAAAGLSCHSQTKESDIVLVNVDILDREGIAEAIIIIDSLNPGVVAIDLQFYDHTEIDKDAHLIFALYKCKNLVMVSEIEHFTGDQAEYRDFARGTLPEYLLKAKTGFSNVILEEDEFHALKRFSTHEFVNGFVEYNFAVRVAMSFDSLRAINFVRSNPKIVDIDYKGGKRTFKKFSADDVLYGKVTGEEIEGKIVMIGGFSPENDDKFFTPLNKKVPPYEPDMYGLEYLANIVAQILEYQ